jgi:hypothetical protein
MRITGQSVMVAMRATIGRGSFRTTARARTLSTVSSPAHAAIESRLLMRTSFPCREFLYRLVYMGSQTREKVVEAAILLLRESGLSGAGLYVMLVLLV